MHVSSVTFVSSLVELELQELIRIRIHAVQSTGAYLKKRTELKEFRFMKTSRGGQLLILIRNGRFSVKKMMVAVLGKKRWGVEKERGRICATRISSDTVELSLGTNRYVEKKRSKLSGWVFWGP